MRVTPDFVLVKHITTIRSKKFSFREIFLSFNSNVYAPINFNLRVLPFKTSSLCMQLLRLQSWPEDIPHNLLVILASLFIQHIKNLFSSPFLFHSFLNPLMNSNDCVFFSNRFFFSDFVYFSVFFAALVILRFSPESIFAWLIFSKTSCKTFFEHLRGNFHLLAPLRDIGNVASFPAFTLNLWSLEIS